MPEISEQSSLEEVAAIVSDALDAAGIVATLFGGSAVTTYTEHAYLLRDLDFVTSAMIADLKRCWKGWDSSIPVCRGCHNSRTRKSSGMLNFRRRH